MGWNISPKVMLIPLAMAAAFFTMDIVQVYRERRGGRDSIPLQMTVECGSLSRMAKKTSRRNFLRTAPVAAAAGLSLTDKLAFSAQASPASGADVAAAAAPFKLFTAKELDADAKALQEKPGDNTLLHQAAGIPCAIVMTTEVHKSAAEFEWHEGRDHIIQIIDGSTLYEVGGTPTGTKVMGPGEWHATGSTGSKLDHPGQGRHAGDPRGTLHKRSTEDSVTFYLISPYGKMTA